MPHMFTDRPRMLGLNIPLTNTRGQFLWESFNAVLYKLGGLVFIAGSIMFFPQLAAWENLGAWTFFVGSLLYLVVTVHDLTESIRYFLFRGRYDLPHWLSLGAAATYVSGTILFTVGSLFFLKRVDWITAGAWCFILGSALFVAGACLNVMLITRTGSLRALQLMNATAISFIVGSVIFLGASIPYLWHLDSAHDRTLVFTYAAALYTVGSVLFFGGGIFNYYRAWLVMRRTRHIPADQQVPPTDPEGPARGY